MKSVALNAYNRTLARRGNVKKLRASGRVPAVIYGGQAKPENVEINAKEFGNLIGHAVSENLLVDLSIKDSAKPQRLALLQEIQHHPLHGEVLHIDFHEVSPTEKVTIMVSVETIGEAKGVKESGGVLEHALFKLKVRALPKDLPEQIVIDVTSLELNKTIHIGDIKAPEGVEILGDKHISVVSVATPRAEVEEVAAATPAAGDVEMTKEKKEDGTEGAAPAKAGDKAAPAAKAGDKAAAAPAKAADKKK